MSTPDMMASVYLAGALRSTESTTMLKAELVMDRFGAGKMQAPAAVDALAGQGGAVRVYVDSMRKRLHRAYSPDDGAGDASQ